jgi:hypothetical protein
MSIFKRLFGIGVTKTNQTERKKREIPFEETAFVMNANRIDLMAMAVDDLNFTTHERGQFVEILFSHEFFLYNVELVRKKLTREDQVQKLKMYLLNRVLPQHQLN